MTTIAIVFDKTKASTKIIPSLKVESSFFISLIHSVFVMKVVDEAKMILLEESNLKTNLD